MAGLPEDVGVVAPGESGRQQAGPSLEEGHDYDRELRQQREDQDNQAEDDCKNPCSQTLVELDVRMGCRDGLVLVPADDVLLRVEDKTGNQDVQDGNRRSQVDVSGSAVGELDDCRQDVVASAYDCRDSVVSDCSDEYQKGCGSERGNDQRKRDGPHDPCLACAHEHRRFFKKGVCSGESAVGHLEYERIVGEGHAEDHSEHAVDARKRYSERPQQPVDRGSHDSLVSQQDDPGVGSYERRHDNRQDSERDDQFLSRHLHARHAVAHGDSDEYAQRRDGKADYDGVAQGPEIQLGSEECPETLE